MLSLVPCHRAFGKRECRDARPIQFPCPLIEPFRVVESPRTGKILGVTRDFDRIRIQLNRIRPTDIFFKRLAIVLIVLGLAERGWYLVAIWLGCDFLVVAIAYGRGSHRVYGKRADGTLPLWSWFVFLPLLVYTTVVWYLMRLFSREPATNPVTEQLVVGRRLLAFELEDEFNNWVDLTAEFSEPSSIRRSPSYRSFPILDGGAPTPEALRAAVAKLRPGRTFIHCAQGHGRTALFALAVLLSSGTVRSVEDGLRMLSAVRPTIRLSRRQHRCIQIYAENVGQPERSSEPPPR